MTHPNSTDRARDGADASSPSSGPFSSVLVPLDGSSFGESVLPHVRAVARPGGSREVWLLSVVDPELNGAKAGRSAELRLQAVEAESYLESVAERLRESGLDVEVEVRTGRPAEEIVRAAERVDADLVALAARTRRSDAHLVSRGVASAVMGSGVASLLVARGNGGARLPPLWREASYRTVVVPVDGSTPSGRALDLAMEVAGSEEAEVFSVRIEPGEDTAGTGAPAGAATASWTACLERPGRREDEADGAEEKRTVRCAGIPQAVAEIAERVEPDLMILAAHGEGRSRGPYGHCARWLLLHTDAPVLVLQDRPVRPREADLGRPGIRRRRRQARPGPRRRGWPGVPAGSTA